jgi:hypothetical protein
MQRMTRLDYYFWGKRFKTSRAASLCTMKESIFSLT